MPGYAPIQLRDSSTVFLTPLPKHYDFLKTPWPKQKYSVNFRHPAYPPDNNLLFRLGGWDHADGGLHHGLAHCACSIFADNRIDGYLSTTQDGEHGDRVDAAWDDVLPADVDYYFYVPYPSESSSPPVDGGRPPYRWPIVTNFQDWTFPEVMHEAFTRCARPQRPWGRKVAQSQLAVAIRERDSTCRVTDYSTSTEAAHLVPDHEKQWFLANNMDDWNNDDSLDSDNVLRALENSVLLRADIHAAFDQRHFVFFPKSVEGFFVHMLDLTPDLGPLYHNTRVIIPYCALGFLYARFAWSIFPLLLGFLGKQGQSPLTIRGIVDKKPVTLEFTNPTSWTRRAIASRSTSPKKRSRIVAGLEDDSMEYDNHKRYCSSGDQLSPPSLHFNLQSLDEDLDDQEIVATRSVQSPTVSEVRKSSDICSDQARFQELRSEALRRQRPEGYIARRPPYDPRRPAREELELMGVEIIDSLDEVDIDW